VLPAGLAVHDTERACVRTKQDIISPGIRIRIQSRYVPWLLVVASLSSSLCIFVSNLRAAQWEARDDPIYTL